MAKEFQFENKHPDEWIKFAEEGRRTKRFLGILLGEMDNEGFKRDQVIAKLKKDIVEFTKIGKSLINTIGELKMFYVKELEPFAKENPDVLRLMKEWDLKTSSIIDMNMKLYDLDSLTE